MAAESEWASKSRLVSRTSERVRLIRVDLNELDEALRPIPAGGGHAAL